MAYNYVKSGSVWGIFAAVLIMIAMSNEVQMAEGNRKYNECLDYCKYGFRKDAWTCFIWCNMRCMPSFGGDCLERGFLSRNKPIIGAADPPLSPAFKALAESPLPQFFEALEKNPDIPELKQFTQATAPSPSPSPTLPPIKAK
ncbi:uncharacterized protein LOC112101053 [Citrus clementina]|uniref:uncharacterized protein LOC112101053 n=1 Tax=Citrus clementina TaxID=85681 RepID=UPI000CED01FE|nr:uncharacterized protein LOC112101053 [Citrus x clementina]